jgi:DNA-binding CsgD family transcriptional regulator
MRRGLGGEAFVGRERELQRLEALLDLAARGSAQVALVRGEAGIGKSRLLVELGARATAASAIALSGACIPLGIDGLPFGPFVEAFRRGIRAGDLSLEPLRSGAGREIEGLVGGRGGDPREPLAHVDLGWTPLFESVLELLGGASRDRPVVLALDDLQWLDRSSRALLLFLLRNLEAERVLLVGSARNDALDAGVLAELGRPPAVHMIDVRPFDRAETEAMVRTLTSGDVAPSLVQMIHRRSDGNPFYIRELIETVREDGEAGLPPNVREIIMSRIVALSPEAQRVLAIASVLGRDVDEQLVGRIAKESRPDLLPAFRELVDNRLLEPRPDGGRTDYQFRHALTLEVAYRDLLPGEARTYHALAADALEAVARPADRSPEWAAAIAHHRERSGDPDLAVRALVAAADAAEQIRAYADARRHLERAAELWNDAAEATQQELGRSDLLARAAGAAAMAGDSAGAAVLLQRAIDELGDTDRMRRGRLFQQLAEHQLVADIEGWGDSTRLALELMPADPPTPERSTALLLMGQWHLYRGDRESAMASLREAIDVAAAAGSEQGRATAAYVLALARLARRVTQEAVDAARQELAAAQASGDIGELAKAWWNLVPTLTHAGRPVEAVEVAAEGLSRLDALGANLSARTGVATNAVEALDRLGRLDDAQRLIDARRVLPDRSGMVSAWAAVRALVALHRGSIANARGLLDADDERRPATGVEHQHIQNRRRIEAELRLAEGRHDAIREIVELGRTVPLAFAWDVAIEVAILRLSIAAEANLAERSRARRDPAGASSAVEAGRRDLGAIEALLATVPAAADHEPTEVDAQHLTAVAEMTRLEGAPDPGPWRAATVEWDALGFRYDACAARIAWAEAVLATGGDRRSATELLRAAASNAADIGAAGLLTAIDGLATRARLDVRHQTAEVALSEAVALTRMDDAYGLTRREREILSLLSSGLTNRQIAEELFISPKTAGVHVSNILGKLGVSGRVEAATLAHRIGLGDLDATRPPAPERP